MLSSNACDEDGVIIIITMNHSKLDETIVFIKGGTSHKHTHSLHAILSVQDGFFIVHNRKPLLPHT